MKSYEKWHTDAQFDAQILPRLIEWSIWDLWGGRGMDPQETKHMERLGRMIGFNKHWWNVLKRDPRHGADDFMSRLHSMTTGSPEERSNSALRVLRLMNQQKGEFRQGAGLVANNAPLKQAYENLERIKRAVNKNPSPTNAEELRLLVTVLTNAHRQGTVPFNDLAELWSRTTGVTEEDPDRGAMKRAIQNHVQTPAQLLGSFFGIGGGIFSSPHNAKEIRSSSMKLLYKIDPHEYRRLVSNVQPVVPPPAQPQPQSPPVQSPKNPPGPNQNPLDLGKMTPEELDAHEERLKQQLAAVDAHRGKRP